jgi:hypothetical protein
MIEQNFILPTKASTRRSLRRKKSLQWRPIGSFMIYQTQDF